MTPRSSEGSKSVSLELILTTLADEARRMTQADAAVILLPDLETGRLYTAATSGLLPAPDQTALPPSTHGPLDAEALARGPLILTDTCADTRDRDLPGAYRSALCFPLLCEGKPIGAIQLYAVPPDRFDEHTIALLNPLARLGALSIAMARSVVEKEASDAGKAHFIRVATHELRSPVAVAQSLIRGVLKGYAGPVTARQAEIFERISHRLDFLEHLVNDLLDLAASKSLAMEEEETAVILNASVGRAVLLLQPRAEEKEVELIHRACCEELVVRGTEEGLDRIFVNLIGNAIKYTPSGGRVIVTIEPVGESEVRVVISDTGIGIPEEALPHLFKEFYRAPNARAFSQVGTGLGLVIVKELVDRYGGRITVESRVGKGSTFSVIFPRASV